MKIRKSVTLIDLFSYADTLRDLLEEGEYSFEEARVMASAVREIEEEIARRVASNEGPGVE